MMWLCRIALVMSLFAGAAVCLSFFGALPAIAAATFIAANQSIIFYAATVTAITSILGHSYYKGSSPAFKFSLEAGLKLCQKVEIEPQGEIVNPGEEKSMEIDM